MADWASENKQKLVIATYMYLHTPEILKQIGKWKQQRRPTFMCDASFFQTEYKLLKTRHFPQLSALRICTCSQQQPSYMTSCRQHPSQLTAGLRPWNPKAEFRSVVEAYGCWEAGCWGET
jgi:hypothetical protein